VEDLWRKQHVWATVFDPSGHEISGRHPRMEDLGRVPAADSPMRGVRHATAAGSTAFCPIVYPAG